MLTEESPGGHSRTVWRNRGCGRTQGVMEAESGTSTDNVSACPSETLLDGARQCHGHKALVSRSETLFLSRTARAHRPSE